ncbi:unnamed protein product [Sphacelaria rigidula]
MWVRISVKSNYLRCILASCSAANSDLRRRYTKFYFMVDEGNGSPNTLSIKMKGSIDISC